MNVEVVVNNKMIWSGGMEDCPHLEHAAQKEAERKAIIEAANNLVQLCRNVKRDNEDDYVENILYHVSNLNYTEV